MSERMTGPCSVDGCERVGTLRRGMCSKHYQRWRAHGNPDVVKTAGRKAAAPLVIIQCPDCGRTVGLAEDRRSVWDVISAHRCEVAS